MIRLRVTYFCLFFFCFALFGSSQWGSSGRVVCRDIVGFSVLAPIMNTRRAGVVVDEKTMRKIDDEWSTRVDIYRARAILVEPDMSRKRRVNVIVKKLNLFNEDAHDEFNNEVRILKELTGNPLTAPYVPEFYASELSVDEDGKEYGSIILEDLCSGSNPFIAMTDTHTLGRILRFSDRFLLMREIARALAAFHSDGYVHHDVAPRNIFWRVVSGKDGQKRVEVKFIDFGDAHESDSVPNSRVSKKLAGIIGSTVYGMPAITKDELVSANIVLDIRNLGELFVPFLLLEWPREDIILELFLGEEASDVFMLLDRRDIPRIQEMLINMIFGEFGESESYKTLEPIISVLDEEVIRQFFASAISTAA